MLGAATLGVFWFASVSCWFNMPYMRPLWRAFGSRDGRDFMVNWPGLRVPARRRTRGLDAAAAAILLGVYPLALWLGWDSGRRARPRSA